ncbi:response regulator transcription factor [Collimonas sp.]|jgi:two-component system OmpR family response regulator|uniref:response regulator transcription factor n=1 Tax=Collimonas sp. TaxID=1963772 RepID=UPI002BF8A086|nr:response regulator transcription factor [Collimonas sp.]HWW08506.1 response regulator transcription factor [Collimonas sp.]
MRILLVEDDPSLGATVQSWLQLDGYAVDWVQRGDSAATALQTHSYDCVLLDRGLPGASGDQLLSGLRAARDVVPVLIITARDTLADRIEGLDLGADDYLVKPFDLEEMSARIRAAIRRHGLHADNLLKHGNIELDSAAKRVTLGGAPIELTAREFAVLHALMLRRRQIVTRAQIEETLYGWGDEVESNAIEVHIHHLRKKLGAASIVTLRGLGYRLKEEHA